MSKCCYENGVHICVHVDEDSEAKPERDGNGAPIGHILAYMGTEAPDQYLVCDGTLHTISDYPELSDHVKKQFGKVNYFGGNGTETFAVPDLRGEFLRGTGTAARNTGTGKAVGVHQDATAIPHTALSNNTNKLYTYYDGDKLSTDDYNYSTGRDNELTAPNLVGLEISSSKKYTPSHNLLSYTTRPTNTAVLYCIKCK